MCNEGLGNVGIVAQPVGEYKTGHVLINADGSIVSLDVSMEDIMNADESNTGFAQPGYHLIKLGNLMIEKN